MNLRLFYTRNTPADHDIDYLCRRLVSFQVTAELVDADSRDGSALCQLYDITQRPALLLTDPDGRTIQLWQGTLPPADVVSGYYRTS
jgi:hypothetical protein